MGCFVGMGGGKGRKGGGKDGKSRYGIVCLGGMRLGRACAMCWMSRRVLVVVENAGQRGDSGGWVFDAVWD